MAGLDPAELTAEWLENQIVGAEDPQRAIENLVDRVLVTAVDVHGPSALESLIARRTSSAMAATALVDVCARRKLPVLAVFDVEEIVAGAVTHLVVASVETRWSWRALTHGPFVQEEDHWKLVLEVAHRAPDDDDGLWLLGDGPVAELQMYPGGGDRLEQLAVSDQRIATILRLAMERP